MLNKMTVWLVVSLFLSYIPLAQAQLAKQMLRVGWLSNLVKPLPDSPDQREEAFRHELGKLGYIQGKNIFVEYRYAEGNSDRLPGLVAGFLALKVDAIVSPSGRGIRVAKKATSSVPIVMIALDDPVATGLVNSLARPGGNLTGITKFVRELSGKRLELFKETIPKISRVGILRDARSDAGVLTEYETVGTVLKVQIRSFEVDGAKPNLQAAFDAVSKNRMDGLIPLGGALAVSYAKPIANLAADKRIATMCEYSDMVEAGCLISYSADELEAFRRAAVYVDKILKGTKPADLPVEQPMKFELVINLKTAKQIGVTIPQWTLMKADRVMR